MVQYRRRSLSILNETPTSIKGPTLLHELVPYSSDASAIEFLENGSKRRKFAYQKLHALSDVLARRITGLTATLENASTVIPVLLPQCPELYIAILAILKAGKAFCPLSLDIPEERLKFILSDISADVVVTNNGLLDPKHSVQGVQTLCVDFELLNDKDDDSTALPHVESHGLAYVLYTSGSTGLPKAVSVSHHAVTQSLLAHNSHIPHFTRFLQFAAPTFDVSIFEIFFPWFRGRTLVGAPRAQMLDNLPGTITVLEADAAELTPTVVGNLLQGRKSVPGLKLLLTIGEMLTQHVVTEYGSTASRKGILWAMYGPTEAAIHCTLQAGFRASSSTGNIGYPLDTVSTFIATPCKSSEGSPDLTILPWGDEGELVLGGHQIAEEYMNRPDLTAASFVDHPVYGRLYRTGDRARFCNDGTIECLGRIVTGQVKLRGQRVELGEIEQTIMKVEGCRMAVATIINSTLVTFCATSSPKMSRRDVLQICKKWLPSFMVPSDVLIVSNMPQLPSGKIDKKSLETSYLQSLQFQQAESVEPNDHTAYIVLRLTDECLEHKLSLQSNLASAGLDSLRAIRIASKLRAEGYNLGAVDVLASDTLLDLVEACKINPLLNDHSDLIEQLSFLDVDSGLTIDRSSVEHLFRCTPLQEAMLAETLSRPVAYCNWVELELAFSRTYEEISTAITLLARENQILRSGFCSSTNDCSTFVQIVWKSLEHTQIEKTSQFRRPFRIDTVQDLLRPFKIQVRADLRRPRILMQLHHAIYDGWSLDLLLDDLDKLLRGFEPILRPQFQAVSRYHIRRQLSTASGEDTSYWTDLLCNYVPTTLVNYNGEVKTGGSLQRHRGSSSVDVQRLSKRAEELAINPQVFFQAATGYILSLYSGSPDVVFGNVTSGRTLPITGIEDIVGPCLASLPCRFHLEALPTVREVLDKVHKQNRQSLQHCALPLRDIARIAKVSPGTQLFDVLFVWQQSSTSHNNSSLAAKILDSADDLEFKLTVEYEPSDSHVSFRVTFDPSAIPEKQVKYLSMQIDEIVNAFLDDPSCTIADVGRCFNTSSLSIANADYRQTRDGVALPHAVETWADVRPDKEAIVLGHVVDGAMKAKDTMTYSNLNKRANQLARLLSQHGVRQDGLVCIMMEKSTDLYVAILAVSKLGSGYLPLVPETPTERVSTILKDAQVRVCINETISLQQLSECFDGTSICLDSVDLSTLPDHNLSTPYNGEHIAYAVFTSGSTGTPKGVLVTQKNLLSNIEFLAGLYPASSESKMLQSCSQAFDVSVFEIFYAWHVGMTLCTAAKEDLFRDFEASINELGVTHLSLTPTVAALVSPNNVPKVEFLVTAGEALTEQVRRQWADRGLYQGYGPSETTNICTIRPSVTATDLINNIGPPFDNTSAFVLDPNSDAILPRGAVGELCFGGEQVFRGYLNRPELNAEKIINLEPYGRIYRSGDMGRLLPDDCILSTGRSDDQVKIRGQRVELGEITSIVLDEDAVADCATLLLSNESGIQTLVNFWVPNTYSPHQFGTLDVKPFRSTILRMFESLSRHLPMYMVPSYLVPISTIPMTMQAKIDKRLLQATFDDLADNVLTLCAPAHEGNGHVSVDISSTVVALSDWERDVVATLAHTLQIEEAAVQSSSSFFNLGLDSVSAIRFCHALRRSDLDDFTVAEVLKNPTISYLNALRIQRAALPDGRKALLKELQNVFSEQQNSQLRSMFTKSGVQVEKINPCTPLQEAMLASGASSPNTYSNTLIFNIKGDVARLQACWKLAQTRHEILRTTFISSDHSEHAFAQVVLKDVELEWNKLNMLKDIGSRMGKVLAGLLASRRPPLYLATYEARGSTKLIFSCHHALYDGIAIANLLQEIQEAYADHVLPPPVSYDRYLQHMISQDLARADEFWSSHFTNFEPTYFPDLTGRVNKNNVSKSTKRDLQLRLSALRAASQHASASVLSFVQAAWAKLLHYYTGEHDLCFGNIVSGRALPEEGLDKLIAPCFNTLPVRAMFDFSNSNHALVKLLHNINVDSMDHQLTPLRRIQTAVLKDGGRLFDTLVILQQPSQPLGDTIWTLEEDLGEMDLPVVCELYQDEKNDCLMLTLHYDTGLLGDKDAQLVAETFDSSLSALVEQSGAAATELLGLPLALRAEANMDFERLPSDCNLLHGAFERNASSLQSDAIALDFLHVDGRHTTWSYQTLNIVANRVAHRLIHHGIGIGDIVPIHATKSPMFYASILGVLKAGAAFAPVHPDLPDARKKLMFDDIKPKVILYTDTSPESMKGTTTVLLDVTELETGDFEACETPFIKNLTGSNLAYCLYTSGSTGVPKAVTMEHRAPIQTIESSRSLLPWVPASRMLQYAAVTFDMSYYDCFMTWTFGFTLCAADQQSMFDNLPQVINSLDITLLDLTPSVAASLPRAQVPNVQWLYCIGEAMSDDVAKEWSGACVNSYGPTEAAFCTTMFPVSEDVKTSVIGRPYPSTSFAVFSPNVEQPLPKLSIGELYIGGEQLARGYLGQSELTNDRFVTRCGQRFYKSGDMVRMLSDGNFEFIGRTDDQVKIRGLRVELGEINHVLQTYDTRVRSVSTQIMRKHAAAKRQLVAYLAVGSNVTDREQTDLQKKAMQAAKRRLPAYMVPQFYLFVETIPKSMAGKVDKKALASIFEATATTNGTPNGVIDDQEWTETKLHVRDVLSKLSNTPVDEISAQTSIYQLGLDSISAVQIAASLRTIGYRVSASDVMNFDNCTDLAEHLSDPSATDTQVNIFDFSEFDQRHRMTVLQNHGLNDQHVEAILPCTPLQQGMLSQFIAQDGSLYYNHLRLQLHSAASDLAGLKDAWVSAMLRHPILRTGFTLIKDEQYSFAMIQYSSDSLTLPWSERAETDPQPATERLGQLQREALEQLHRPMWDLQVIASSNDVFLDLSMFHALFDAHSLRLIFDDVVAFYNDWSLPGATDIEPVLSDLLQFSGNHGEETERFWTELGKKTVPSRFPNMAPLRYETTAPSVHSRQSSMSVSEIEEGCRTANVTLQAAGLASWSTILSVYTGEPSVTTGVVLSGRTSEAANNAVFPCINTVPLPCLVTDDEATTLKSVMELNAQLHQHQFTPLNKIQKIMGTPNEPLFDTLFAFQKTSGGSQENELWTITEEKATAEYPLSIELELKQDALEYRLTYLPHMIPSEQAKLILDQLDKVMQNFIIPDNTSASEDSLISSLYSITPAREPTLLSEVELLHEFVEFTALEHPDRIAFEFATSIHNGQLISNRWTYSQLNSDGNRIAHLLISNGIRPGGLVGVCFEKCPEASFAMLGVLKAGCAFVAIDPSAPSARQEFIVDDSGAQAVLSMSTQSTKFAGDVKVPVFNLDKVATFDFPATNPQLARTIDPQDLSYCLYTSGTTGTPKGCELTHENAVQAMLAFQRLFAGHWDEESRWLQFASFHFDVSILEQYWSWSVGICVVSAPRDLIFEDIANSIRTLNITHIDLTPSLAQILRPEDVPSLCKGVFITGGESLKQEILDVWGPQSVIYNGYGPTEATIGCTMYPRVPANGKPSNIGPQFDNVGSYVLKPGTGIPVLRGGMGELCISGKLVGKGYLNRPELTQERFAYLDRFGERVYRTGDLVRILHDRTFDFLGRADDQVKLRGQRLEIGEINSVIRQSSKEITDVATLVLKHPKQQKEQLVAFAIIGIKSPREPKVLLVEAARLRGAKEACLNQLPPYMIPTHFVPLASMPLNINNKADGKQLKQIYEGLSSDDLQQLSTTSTNSNDAWSHQEEQLRHVLAEALNIGEESIYKNSSLFELGMDSISAIAVSRSLKHAGYTQATVAVLLRHSDIHRLTKAISSSGSAADNKGSFVAAQQAISATQHRHRRAVARALGENPRNIEALAPCTPLQQGMIARYLDSDNGLYFNTFRFELSPNCSIPRLQEAWNTAYRCTDILRTKFVNTDDGYVQAVLHHVPLPWSEHKNGDGSSTDLQSLRQRWLEVNRSDLTRPFELHLVNRQGSQTLVVHIFHGLYDGNSIGTLFERVHKVYDGVGSEAFEAPAFHSALPHGPLRVAEGARQFWESQLANLSSSTLPTLTKEPKQGTIVVTRDLGSLPVYDSVRKKLNVTAQAIAQACWMHVLQSYAQVPISTGMVVSGRSIDLEGADRVVGPMFNTIPYQHYTHAGDTWASIIARVHEFNTAALPYQHTPLRDIIKWCKRTPDQPLFDTLFVYQIAQRDQYRWSNNDAWNLLDDDAVADYPLAIEIEQKSDSKFSLTLVTEGCVSSAKSSNELLDRFEEALTSALADPSIVPEVTVNSKLSNTKGTGTMRHTTNGIDGTAGFDWNQDAAGIREEIASLTGIDISEVNESTSIFELGLDSIDAIKLSSRLKKRGVSIAVSGIMRGLNIRNMVKHISPTQNEGMQSQIDEGFALRKDTLWRYAESHVVDMRLVENILPLTPLQEAMVAEMIASDYTRYYNFDVAALRPDIDVDALRQAWVRIISAIPMLRTAFIEVNDPQIDGSYAQVVIKQDSVRLLPELRQCSGDEKPDFSDLFEDVRRAAVQSKPLNPPVKIMFVQTPIRTYQVLSIAHALYDGWSLGLLHGAVNAMYRGTYSPSPSHEAALANILAGSGPDAASFWQDHLSGLKPSILLRRGAGTIVDAGRVHRREVASDVPLSDTTESAKNSKVSLQTLGQTVFALTLASYVHSLDVTYGCVLSGRDDDERSKLIFPTMNTVAMRTVLHGSRLELLQYVQDNFNNIKQWQHFPLRRASALSGAQGKLFDSLFIYQKSMQADLSVTKKLYDSIESQSDVEYPVCVEMEIVNNKLIWRCAVKEEVLDQEGAQSLLSRLDHVLRNVIESPDKPTIATTPNGISVCGLPAFRGEDGHAARSGCGEQQQHHVSDTSLSKTATSIRAALASVAQIPEEGIEQGMSIFHIGLDSISAIKVSSILRKQGIALSVGEMLRAGTVEKMAQTVDERTRVVTNGAVDPSVIFKTALDELGQESLLRLAGIESTQVEQILPLASGQLYILSMWLNTKGANFYPEFTYNIEGTVSFDTLQRSWQGLVSENPVLRTHIVATGQSDIPYLQIVLKEASASLTDTTNLEDEAAERTRDKGPMRQPWVHLLISRTSSGWTLRLKIHHVLYDGVSLPLMMQQLQSLCNGATSSGSHYKLEQYCAIAHAASAPSHRKAFWTRYLENTKPHANVTPEIPFRTRTEIFNPGLLQTYSLEATARQNGVSIQALFLAAYAKLHAARSDRANGEDVTIGIYLANRSLPIDHLATAAIPIVNLLPLLVRAPLGTNLLGAATQIQSDLQRISEPVNATASLYEISEWTGVKVDTFVNFLSLPDTQDDDGVQEGGIKITQRDGWQDAVSRVTEVEEGHDEVLEEMRNERVNDAYLHAVDVEATIHNGKLDVGVFAPTEMLSLDDGERLMKDLRSALESLNQA